MYMFPDRLTDRVRSMIPLEPRIVIVIMSDDEKLDYITGRSEDVNFGPNGGKS